MEGHGAIGPTWVLALEHSVLGEVMRQSLWLYPAANVLHVLAAGTLIGSILAFDLRLLGLARQLPAAALAALLVPIAATAIAVALPTGFLLFAADASAVAANPVFRVKLGLIALGLANVVVMHLGALRHIRQWGASLPVPARAAGAVSLVAWVAAAVAGRLIAYF